MTDWRTIPLAKADARVIDPDQWAVECLIAIADARDAQGPVTFWVPSNHHAKEVAA